MIAFDTSYARLPARFFAPQAPTPVAAPRLIRLNSPLAEALGLDAEALASDAGVAMLAGNAVPEGAASIALAYAGHQFGNFVPQLGDGRAILLGEVVAPDGSRHDIQLKGAGRTPYSRGGDGRAALGPVLREYVLSEAMAALGVPTTRALAAVATGEWVFRDAAEPGAILTRVAASHMRVGTFQFFAARGDVEALHLLADQAIARHYPDAAAAAHPVRALLAGVVAAQARLVAQWMALGFVHGVMNTDNCSIAGQTIDYGPCAFLEAYQPLGRFSAIDQQGRYAYGRQPAIVHWNLTRLAEALLPLLDSGENEAARIATEVLDGFGPAFEAAYLAAFRGKLGLAGAQAEDAPLIAELLGIMAREGADFTATFRTLAEQEALDAPAFAAWQIRWRARRGTAGASMLGASPAYVPRNHLVEAAIRAAVDRDDVAPFHALVDVMARPFETVPGREAFATPALPSERVLRTFCGT